MPSIRSQLFFFDGFQLSAASCSIETFPAIHRSTGWPPCLQPPGEHHLFKLLGRRAHTGVTLAKSDHLKPVSSQLRGQLRRIPAVNCHLFDMVSSGSAH